MARFGRGLCARYFAGKSKFEIDDLMKTQILWIPYVFNNSASEQIICVLSSLMTTVTGRSLTLHIAETIVAHRPAPRQLDRGTSAVREG